MGNDRRTVQQRRVLVENATQGKDKTDLLNLAELFTSLRRQSTDVHAIHFQCDMIYDASLGAVLFATLVVTRIDSQLCWIQRVIGLGERFILGKPQRIWLKVIVGVP